MQTKLRSIGNSVGLTVPKEALLRLGAHKNDDVFIRFNASGDMVISRYDPEFAEQVESVRKSKSKYMNALKELSKT